MSSTGQGDWAGKILAFFFGLAILVVGLFFVVDRAQAIFTPKQYAAATAVAEAEKAAAEAREAEVQRKSDAVQAERNAVQRKDELTFTLASEAFSNFKRSLRDPRSAQFRDVWAVKGQLGGTEIIAACGVVNAQNAFGGYVGDTPFLAAGSYIYTPDHPSFADRFQTICLDGVKVMKLN
jgi:hypothetical protein